MRWLTCDGSRTGCWSQHPKVSEQQCDIPAPTSEFCHATARGARTHSGGVKSRTGFCKTSVMVAMHSTRNAKSLPHPNH